ncbi:MAG: DUF1428 family protein [Burkholderiaceae bacterium]
MACYAGFVAAVPTVNREKYIAHVRAVWPLMQGYGALRMVEAWSIDVPHGRQTDFHRATLIEAGDVPVFDSAAARNRGGRQ